MAISIIGAPPGINTAFNVNRWVIDSDNKYLSGFRYLVKVVNSVTSQVIKEFIVPPRPVDAFGEFDLSKVLSDQLDVYLNFQELNTDNYFEWNKFKINYKLVFGEKYIVNWEYDDTEFVSGTQTKLVELPSPSVPHPFLPGDVVMVVPNNPSIRPNLQGLYNIIALENITNFPIINTPWVSTGLNPGVVKYADNRSTSFYDLYETDIYTVYKSALPVFNWVNINIGDEYLLGDSDSKLFTNFKDEFWINPSQDLYWVGEYNSPMTAVFERDDEVIFTVNLPAVSADEYVRYINVAPKNNYSTGTGSLFNTDIKYYDFSLYLTGQLDVLTTESNLDGAYYGSTSTISPTGLYEANLIGGSGTGARVAFEVYSDDTISPFTLINRGTGYQSTDSLSFPGVALFGSYDYIWTPINLDDTQISKKYRINVYQRCERSDIEILFEDRMGGFSSFAFDAMYQTSVNVTKEQYNQPIQMDGSTYDPTNIQGLTTISIDFDKQFTLRTKTIINRLQDLYFEELLTSANTFIKLNGEYQRVDIVTSSDSFRPVQQRGLRRRELVVKLANKDIINF